MQNTEMQYFRLFRDVCKVINSSLNVGDVLQLIAKNLVKALDVKACAVFLLDREKNTLEVSTTYGLSQNYLKKGPLSADKSIGASLKEESVLIYDVANDPRVQYPEEAKREGIASILSVPISVRKNIIGVLRLYTAQQRKFSNDECELITGLADMGGIAIDHARMYDHLKADHERLIHDVHQWFDYANMP